MKQWGLFSKNKNVGVPLKSLNISIKILHNVARVLYTQVYYNQSDLLVESQFFFPISPDACFDSFEASFLDTTIKGVVKKKEEAKEAYEKAIEQGHTAAYSEINPETGDIMKVQIGNIPPKTDIAITYSYIQKLDTILNKFWCFRLFSTITPRYNSNPQDLMKEDIKLLASYPTVSAHSQDAYPWNIEVEIQSPSPIEELKSLSHGIITEFGNERHTCKILLDKKTKHTPNKDFVLMYNNGKEDKIDYLLTPFEDGYCAMVTLLADFEAESASKLVSESVKAKDVNHSIDMVRGEYIFLIDRSGSMSGGRIEMARNSLVVFLKSLPKDSYYNVISFGSGYKSLSSSSEKYTPKTLESTIKKVQGFSADMGGTEILQPLQTIFNTPLKQGYPRFIFLLTDGGVSNTGQVLTLIKNNNHKARVFTIGIGNGCSPELIVRGASYGRGKHEFVANPNETYEKVVSLLNASLSPCFSDLSFEAENFDAVVKSVSPDPATIPFLLNGQPITFFLLLREAAFGNGNKYQLNLRFYDSRTKEYKKVGVTLETDQAMENQLIPKLAVHDMIKRLEEQKENAPNDKLHVLWMDKAEVQSTLLELSLKYGILCKETAFFCEVCKNDGEILELEKASVTVPSIESSDYAYNAYLPRGAGGQQRVYLQNARQYPDKAAGCCDAGIGGGGGSRSYATNYSEPESVSPPMSKYEKLCLDIIMKQNFEGFWDPNDKELNFIVVKLGKLPDVVKEVDVAGELSKTIWMTVLVLLWLEKACENQKKVWLLIHQKGKEWLKSKGVDYEEVKALGESVIKAE